MKILVTGGAGFIGSNLVEELAGKHEVTVLDNFSLGREENLSAVREKIELVKGDICDEALVNRLSAGADVIFNEAAASSSPMFLSDLKKAFAINVEGFINILNAARKNDVSRVIYASTSSIYGNNPTPLVEDMRVEPPNFYSASKLANENLAKLFAKEYRIETVGFRYMSVYGPHEKSKGGFANLVSQFLWAMQRGESPVIYGDGTQTRDFTFVRDVVLANILAMEKPRLGGEIFNIGTGRMASLNELVYLLNRLLGTSIKPVYVENKVKNYIESQQADTSKIMKVLGFVPKYTLEDGIREMLSSQA